MINVNSKTAGMRTTDKGGIAMNRNFGHCIDESLRRYHKQKRREFWHEIFGCIGFVMLFCVMLVGLVL